MKKSERAKPPRPPASGSLPLWFRLSILGAFAAALLVHMAVDFFDDTYDGVTLSLMLGGIVGAAFAADDLIRKGRDDPK